MRYWRFLTRRIGVSTLIDNTILIETLVEFAMVGRGDFATFKRQRI